jgi:hypothetical protein
MAGWWRKWRRQAPQPESLWTVTIAVGAITATDDRGATRTVDKSALAGIAIETNDSGPWGSDVWWLLFGADRRVACQFPQRATGEAAVLDYLLALPDFDHAELACAMGSTDNALFVVWRSPDLQRSDAK